MRLLDQLLALVAPPACLACRQPVSAGNPLCGACHAALPWLHGPRCTRCGLPSPCRPCPARGHAYELAWAPLAYAGPTRTLVLALKERGMVAAADAMAAAIVANAPLSLLAWPLVPVPTHPTRRRRRGLDHAALLATALGRRAGLPVMRCLTRRGAPDRQLGVARATRLRRDRLLFECAVPAPPRALLVDDVHTTGATLDAAARTLRVAGCGSIHAIAYARTLR